MGQADVSIHATLAGGDGSYATKGKDSNVSIHATLAGGDLWDAYQEMQAQSFYPRHPRGWRLQEALDLVEPIIAFLSTPPSRVATRRPCYYRALSGGVSIHATLAGGDSIRELSRRMRPSFLSTPPSRVATLFLCYHAVLADVSIHATLAGGDAARG